MPISSGLSMMSWWLVEIIYFRHITEYHKSNAVPFSGHPIRKNIISTYLITCDIIFDHMVKAMSIGFLHRKVTISPFVIDKYLGTDTNTLFLLKCLSSDFSHQPMDLPCNSYCCDVAYWWLTNSHIPSSYIGWISSAKKSCLFSHLLISLIIYIRMNT